MKKFNDSINLESKRNFTIITKTFTVPTKVELFNAQRSFARILREDFVLFVGLGIDYEPTENRPVIPDGKVFFGQRGELLVYENIGTVAVEISSEMPYRSLIDTFILKPIKVTKIRLTSSNPLQLTQELKLVKRNLLTGAEKESIFNPTRSPENRQPNIIDFSPVDMVIDGSTSLEFTLTTEIKMVFDFEYLN